MWSVLRSVLPLLCLLPVVAARLQAQIDSLAPTLTGLSNHGRTGDKPYVTAGTRAYLIGTQDGRFPDLGEHLPGEMGGAWLHPIKLFDGFRATIAEPAARRDTTLSAAAEFVTYPHGNHFRYGPVLDSLEVERFEFSPDGQEGLVVRYELRNSAARPRALTVSLAVKTDLRPVWFSDSLGITDARDTAGWDSTARAFVARDTEHPWFCVWGAGGSADATPLSDAPPIESRGQGMTTAARYGVQVPAHGASTLTFVFAGSTSSSRAALRTYRTLGRDHIGLLEAQRQRYTRLLRRARLTIPDRRLQQVYDWVKVNNRWLVREVPGIGRGINAGLMEYPWWFGTDAGYALQAVVATGESEVAQQTLRLLRDQSRKANGNGRIIHEVTTNGGIVNRGNTQETAQFIMAVGRVFDWTGDVAFAREMYPTLKQGLQWLLVDMDRNRDLFPEGYGIMEVSGLNAELIDVAVYTHQALAATARMARVLGDPKAAAHYGRRAAELARRINQRFWATDAESYGDFYGTRAQAMSAAQGAIRQIRHGGDSTLTRHDRESIAYYEALERRFSAMPDTSRGWLTNKNWVIATPMEVGIAPRDRAIPLLEKIRRENVGDYGPYLSAVERRAMMTIATGVQAVAEARYGRMDQSLWYVGRIADTFGRTLPGSINEMMPDYGCFAIAWTSYGVVVPLIEYVFGIRPDAVHRTVVLAPRPPTGWDEMRIDELPVGSTTIAFARRRTAKGVEYRVEAREDGWTFLLRPEEATGAHYTVNGRPVSPGPSGIRLTGRSNRVVVVQPS
jgi:glycogen debranching enzyme